jgi:hypothetical protein
VAGTTRAVPAPIPGPDEPDGLQGLDLLAAQARTAEPAEPVAPFGPDVPLTRPPREQSRLVLVVLGVLVVVVGVFAGRQLFSFDPAPLIGPGGGATGPVATATEGTPSSGATPGASPSRGSTPATPPVAVAAAQALDPQGDNNENNELAARAIDGDPRTVWRSERYDTPEFGGIKSGVGLALDLGDVGSVAGVTLDAPGSDGAVEVRVGDSPDYEGSRVVARAEVTGSGRLVLTAAKPVRTQYLLVWFTRVPQQDSGERRVVVDEVDVR